MNIIAGKDLEIPAFLRRENKVANTDTGAVPEKKVNGAEPTPKTETSEAVAPVKKEPPLRSGTPAQQKAADEERAKKRAAEGLPPTEAKQAPVKKEAKPAAKPSAKVIPMRKAEQAPAKGKAAPAPAKGKATPAKAAPAPAKGKAPGKAAPGKAAPAKGKAEPAKAKASSVEKDAYGFKKGSLKSRAAAMYAGAKGATLLEVKKALDSSQLNVLVELEQRGCSVRKKKEKGLGKREITRYFLSGRPKSK